MDRQLLAKTAILRQCVIPEYRLPLFRALCKRRGERLQIACGAHGFAHGLTTVPDAWMVARRLENQFMLGRRLLYQSGLWNESLNAGLVVVEFNLRTVSTWMLLHRRCRRGLPTVMWGHAAGRSRSAVPLKKWMFRCSQGFVAYTRTQATELQKEFPKLPIWVAPNSMMWKSECFFHPRVAGEVSDVLYVGRLVREKKPALLVTAFAAAARRGEIPEDARLVLVGDGPERAALESFVDGERLRKRVDFRGHVGSIDALREIYSRALVSVSPGYIGLSATQSFSFGVPMLVADREPHSPEIEACVPGRNTEFFHSDNVAELAAKLAYFYRDRTGWVGRREEICVATRDTYSMDAMADTFESVLDRFVGRN